MHRHTLGLALAFGRGPATAGSGGGGSPRITYQSQRYRTVRSGNTTWVPGSYKLDRWEEAVKPLCNAIELKSHEASTHYWLGIAYSQLKRHAEAITEFQKALRTLSERAGFIFRARRKFGRDGPVRRSSRCLQNKSFSFAPEHADAYFNLGVANRELGRHDEEIQAYTKAAELNPQDFTIWGQSCFGLFQLQRSHELAIETWGRVIQLATRQRANINESDVGLRAPRAL